MKKNIFLIFIGIFIGIGFILLFPAMLFFGANKLLESGNIELAGKIYSQLGQIFPQNDSVKMKQADILYKEKKYQEAGVKYLQVECKNTNMCFILQHNLGNTLYRFGDTFEEIEQKKKFWEQSLGAYKEALTYKKDLQTEQNYEFVLKKLRELEELTQSQQQKEDEQNQESDEEKKQQEQNQESQQENNSQEQNQNGQEIVTNPNTGIGGDISEVEKELSTEEKAQIEKYIEGLKQEEKQNAQLNKSRKQNDFLGNETIKNTDW